MVLAGLSSAFPQQLCLTSAPYMLGLLELLEQGLTAVDLASCLPAPAALMFDFGRGSRGLGFPPGWSGRHPGLRSAQGSAIPPGSSPSLSLQSASTAPQSTLLVMFDAGGTCRSWCPTLPARATATPDNRAFSVVLQAYWLCGPPSRLDPCKRPAPVLPTRLDCLGSDLQGLGDPEPGLGGEGWALGGCLPLTLRPSSYEGHS